MSILIAKELHTEQIPTYEPDGAIQRGWSYLVHSAYKLDATGLGKYCTDNPQFWGNYKTWLPYKLRPGASFWVEYETDEQMRVERPEHDGLLTSIGFHIEVSVDSTEPTLDIATFYRVEKNGRSRIERSPYKSVAQVDADWKITGIEHIPAPDDDDYFRMKRENFFALFPLSVISNIDNHDVLVTQKKLHVSTRNLHSKNKKKRQAAAKKSKIRYWTLEIAEALQDGDSIEAEDERNHTHGTQVG